MTPHGRKPHANAFVMLRGREVLDPIVAPAHAHRADRDAIVEGLADIDDDGLPTCFYSTLPCGCETCGDRYCEACGGPCCGLADEQGRCDCIAVLAAAQRVTIASRLLARMA